MQELTITRPDDWHLHLRDGAMMAAVLPHTAERFARAIVMPNLKPPVTDAGAAEAYHDRIIAALPEGSDFQPLMTLYLTDNTTPETIRAAKDCGIVHGVKLYPAGATTNSESGVTDIKRVMPALEAMAACGLPLLVHGEVTDPEVDPFDREAVFIENILAPLVEQLPGLKVVFEHITTRDGVAFVRAAPERVAATITVHHLLYDRRALFDGGLRPHLYCLPVLKRRAHRDALLQAATSGDPKFFLGTDSAPHARSAKESDCGCAGIYTAHAALELYAEVFEDACALDQFEAFTSFHGADFYGLPRNTGTVTLQRVDTPVADRFAFGDDDLIPLRAGGSLRWRLAQSG